MPEPISWHARADLEWLLSTPPLLTLGDPLPFAWRPGKPPPAALPDPDPGLPLGIWAERLLACALRARDDIDEVLCNLPARTEGVTLGEFDFLIRPRGSASYFHLEFAVKFFLGLPDNEDWPGLNPRDSFQRKLEKLQQRQLQLARHPAVAPLLAERNIRVERAGARVLGMLFYPLEMQANPPAEVCPDHPRGYWIHASALARKYGELRFIPLPHRSRWLSATPLDGDKTLNGTELARLAAKRPLLALRLTDSGAGLSPAPERWAIVPDRWPDA